MFFCCFVGRGFVEGLMVIGLSHLLTNTDAILIALYYTDLNVRLIYHVTKESHVFQSKLTPRN